ncbi:hypothetical protein HGA88_04440 [Candidatus Roizmanbacteria bacterium]|nr:hypothetical protein [Candidatus Roizmanbacteria bacterium]
MDQNDNILNQIHEVVTKNSSGIIALPSNPTQDAAAAASSLYLVLTQLGKTVTIVCDTIPSYDLTAIDKIQNSFEINGDNLVISFPYVEGAIDKVDYNIQNSFFNLVISPRPGQPKLETDKIKYTYSGGKIDFIFVVDAPNLNSLGSMYRENQNEFTGKTIINIDRHLINDNFGMINFVNKTASSTSELMLQVLTKLQPELDRDSASNLYAGITAATNNFSSYSVNAVTFETAAMLLRAGAIKKPAYQKQPGRTPFELPQRNFAVPNQPRTIKQNQDVSPIEDVEKEPEEGEKQGAPQEWLKPKIFRGTGLV